METNSLRQTANDEFKSTNQTRTSVGLIGSVLLTFALFVFVQPFEAADLGDLGEETEVVNLPPEVEIPPPPEQIARPATPRVAQVELSEDITIAPTTFETNPVENLPPPPAGGNASDRPSFIPYDTPPSLRNRSQVQAQLQREYPRNLRDAGIGGRVELWLYVNEGGTVEKSQVKTSSGNALLDEAAQRVAAVMRFTPAKNRDKTTAVWVSQYVTFEVI